MHRLRTTIALLALAAAGLPVHAAAADGPKLSPGKWQFESTISTSRMAQPRKESETRCITEEQSKADPLAAIGALGNCNVTKRTEKGDSLDFEVDCAGETDQKIDMKMRGTGVFTGDGDTASGRMDLTFETPEVPDMSEIPSMPQLGGKMTLNQSWTGKRVGECD